MIDKAFVDELTRRAQSQTRVQVRSDDMLSIIKIVNDAMERAQAVKAAARAPRPVIPHDEGSSIWYVEKDKMIRLDVDVIPLQGLSTRDVMIMDVLIRLSYSAVSRLAGTSSEFFTKALNSEDNGQDGLV